MSILKYSQNYSYDRSVFEHPSTFYDSYQENGTKYLKSRKPIEEQLKQQLNACAGEIFLSGITSDTRAEQIAEIAALLGEIYILRFKVNFSGNSRGFAYLQYMDPNLMQMAIIRLPSLFRQYFFPMIRVRESLNSSKLLLKKTDRMSPFEVIKNLEKLINFQKVVGREICCGYFEYEIIFKCNEEAVHARRDLLKSISTFGRNALLVWDTTRNNENNIVTNTTVKFNHNGNVSNGASSPAPMGAVNFLNTPMVNTPPLSSLSMPGNFTNKNSLNPLNMNLF